jgi:hypothetical protein
VRVKRTDGTSAYVVSLHAESLLFDEVATLEPL